MKRSAEAEQKLGNTVRKVAVKTLHAELSRDPSVTQRFNRECGTVASSTRCPWSSITQTAWCCQDQSIPAKVVDAGVASM